MVSNSLYAESDFLQFRADHTHVGGMRHVTNLVNVGGETSQPLGIGIRETRPSTTPKHGITTRL